jgi:hypothetical protein
MYQSVLALLTVSIASSDDNYSKFADLKSMHAHQMCLIA